MTGEEDDNAADARRDKDVDCCCCCCLFSSSVLVTLVIVWLIVFSSKAVVVLEVADAIPDKVAVVLGCSDGCRLTGHDDTVTASVVPVDNDGNADDNRRFRMRTATTITCQGNETKREEMSERERRSASY